MPGNCLFNEIWLREEKYKRWLSSTNNPRKAKCLVCVKQFDLAKMGESALKAHMSGKKHMALMSQKPGGLSHFIKGTGISNPPSLPPTLPNSVSSSATSSVTDFLLSTPSHVDAFSCGPKSVLAPTVALASYVSGKECLTAEIYWALKCVQSNYSFNSCCGTSELFSLMFPDSMIAKQFKCGERKCAYLCCFGIAPYCEKNLFKCLEEEEEYTLMFDETLNKSTQRKQMDILIRFWNSNINEVSTRYLTSSFIGHSTADDLYKAFCSSTETIKFQNVMQVSMDGPAVNMKLFRMLQTKMQNDHGKKLLDLGSCGLHTLHNSFKTGVKASGWEVQSFLRSLHYLFNDSPARVENYMESSKSKKVGIKFCEHRWLENVPTAQRALEIFDDVRLFVFNAEKGKFTKPDSKSYKCCVSAVKDNLFKVKLHFFLSVALILQPFLKLYQSTKPLLPFFAEDLTKLINQCVTTFSLLKKEEVKNIDKPEKLAFYFFEANVLNEVKNFGLGFSADKLLKELVKENKVTEKNLLLLKHEAQKFLLTMIKHILEKSPLKYSLVRNMSCLNPASMARQKDVCLKKMKTLLSSFVECGHVKEEECDPILLEYGDFLNSSTEECRNFSTENGRLDDFFYRMIYLNGYNKLWIIVKKVLILSHGQASVESGFSINKAMEVENLKERSYVALRQIKDYLKISGGVEKVIVTKELLSSASSARQKYMSYLEKQKSDNKEKCVTEKRQRLQHELETLKKKKINLEDDVVSLHKSADELSEAAEKTRQITFISQSNAMRKSAREKEKIILQVTDEIKHKIEELRSTC